MFTYHESAVTPEFRQAILQRFPLTSRRAPCLRLLDHLLFGTAVDVDERLLMLPYELLEQFRNGSGKTKNFSAGKLLEKFDREFFPIEYRSHSAITGKVRLLTDVQFPYWLIEARDEMLRQPATARTVRLVSGKPADLKADVVNLRSQALAASPPAKSAMAQDVLDYLNGLDESLFDHLPARVADALSLIETFEPGSRAVQSSLIGSIHCCPKPLYRAVSNSARLYPAGPSFLGLKSCVRDLFTEGWIKLDLRQAQFAILSSLWEAEGLRSYVHSVTGSVWDDLIVRSGMVSSSDAKSAVKQAVYSMLYGSQENNVRRRLAKEVGSEAADRFLALPIVRLILDQREDRCKRLYSELGVDDAYGNRLELPPFENKRQWRREAMSILACQAQSYELPTLYPLIEYSRQTAETRDPFVVTAWLHDGVWAACSPDSAERHLAHVEDLVRASSAKYLGFIMQLDTETPHRNRDK
ncbi:MAG: hypothetical protein EOP84_03790 [Verrucomicrobiaceae bacterium]|nr:MAG: hypothetical protein EOP84_03790 [Verrucomicrobiaceae bacterium]